MNELLTWVNSHHCGVEPCGVLTGDGSSVQIRFAAIDAAGGRTIERETVRNLQQARDALGY